LWFEQEYYEKDRLNGAIWHMPYLKSMEIPILTCQQPKRWRIRLAGTRFVSYNYKGTDYKIALL
jgi:hypothetical protein